MGKFRSKIKYSIGRPQSDKPIVSFDVDEIRQYNQDKKAKSREKHQLIAPSIEPTASSSHKQQFMPVLPITPSTPPSRSRGRPPLNEGAMTPKTLKKRKCNLMRKSRMPEKLNKIRVKAADNRWKVTPQKINKKDSSEINYTPEESDSSKESVNPHRLSNRSIYRAQSEVIKVLPNNVYDSTNIFVSWYRQFGPDFELKNQLKSIQLPTGKLSYRQLRYQTNKVYSIIQRYQSIQSHIIQNWLNRLLQHSVIEAAFDLAGVTLPLELVPKSLQVARISRKVRQQILSTSSRTKEDQRNVSVQYVINVVKAS